jgi:hypothetical protein
VSHLTPEKLDALLKDPKALPELRGHLLAGCEICDHVLAQTHSAALDGATDDALMSLRPPFLEADSVRTARLVLRPSPRRWVPAAAAALAAMVLAVVGGSRLSGLLREPGDGLKGAARVVTVSLSAVRKAPDGALVRVENGAAVPASGTLLLRYQASDATTAPVTLVRENGQRETLQSVSLSAGLNDLPIGVALEGEHGALTVEVGAAHFAVQVGP